MLPDAVELWQMASKAADVREEVAMSSITMASS
jgi:hypothetical protein